MSTVSRRDVARDVAGLLAIAASLVAIYLLVPPAVQRSLVFDHGDPRPHALLTAAYVHASLPHLFSNLVAYVVAAGFTHWLCLASGGRRWFWRTVPVFLTVLPVLVNLTDWFVFTVRYPALALRALGFSGVAAGFGGMLLVALVRFVRVHFDRDLGRTVGTGTFLLVLLLVALRYDGGFSSYVAVFVLTALFLLGGSYVYRNEVTVGASARRPETRQRVGVVGLILVVIVAVVLALFPRADAVTRGGVLTGVVAHAAGFGWGIALSWATSRLTDETS